MESRLLAPDLLTSRLALGCNNLGKRLDAAASVTTVRAALDTGITLFDTSDSYGAQGNSEIFLGRGVQSSRHEVVIATKFGTPYTDPGHTDEPAPYCSPRYINHAVRRSLTRLGTDYIDLYQMHVWDQVTPFSEILGALQDLQQDGLIRYSGHSNMTTAQLAEVCLSRQVLLRNSSE
jgi:aryl-alcohol dehydrogenase-like predicted oxidoreductase